MKRKNTILYMHSYQGMLKLTFYSLYSYFSLYAFKYIYFILSIYTCNRNLSVCIKIAYVTGAISSDICFGPFLEWCLSPQRRMVNSAISSIHNLLCLPAPPLWPSLLLLLFVTLQLLTHNKIDNVCKRPHSPDKTLTGRINCLSSSHNVTSTNPCC